MSSMQHSAGSSDNELLLQLPDPCLLRGVLGLSSSISGTSSDSDDDTIELVERTSSISDRAWIRFVCSLQIREARRSMVRALVEMRDAPDLIRVRVHVPEFMRIRLGTLRSKITQYHSKIRRYQSNIACYHFGGLCMFDR